MSKKKEKKLRNEKCASNRETYIYTMMCCLLVDLSALFVHIHIYTRVQRTRQHLVQIDEKIQKQLSLSLSCSIVCLPSHIHPSFLLLRLEATISITATTAITHTHTHSHIALCVIIIINNNISSERDERANEFCFVLKGRERKGDRLS